MEGQLQFNNVWKYLNEQNNDPTIITGSTTCSYAQLWRRTSAIAHILDKQCKKENIIGIEAKNGVDSIATILACWKLGKGYMPIDFKQPFARNEAMIKEAKLQTLFCQSSPKFLLNQFEWTSIPNDLSTEVAITTPAPDHTAYVLFTSGSSGKPKGVSISFKNLYAFAQSFSELSIKLSPQDRILMLTELTFDMSLLCFLPALMSGAALVIPDSKTPKYLSAAEALDKDQITYMATVPSMIELLSPHFSEMNFPKLKTTLFCGEALNVDLANRWSECAPNTRMFNIYGPTECTVFTHARELVSQPYLAEESIVSLGYSNRLIKTAILDHHNQISLSASDGELLVSGPQITNGYLLEENNSDSFIERIDDGKSTRFYKTGDVVRQSEDGHFFFLGRKDDQVQIMGHRVELNEIIAQAKTLDGKAKFYAVVYKGSNRLPRIVLFMAGGSGDKNVIAVGIKQRVPDYMWPSSIIELQTLPSLPNGKTDRQALMHLAKTNLTQLDDKL